MYHIKVILKFLNDGFTKKVKSAYAIAVRYIRYTI